MKKFLVFSVIWLCLTSLVKADEVLIDGINYFIKGDVVGVIAGENKYKGDIKVPETIVYNGVEYQVTRIESGAFVGCTELTSVELPECINYVSGFPDCTKLASINIPEGLTKIDDSMFRNCVNLSSCKLPDNIKSIGQGAFEGCTKLKELKIPSGVETIRMRAFSKCTSLQSIEIPDGVQSINAYLFEGCTNLRSVVLPDSLKSIPIACFMGCASLSSIALPKKLEIIDEMAFENCTSLTSIEIPRSVTQIQEEAFYGCGIREITIPEKIQNWSLSFDNSDIFRDCKNLESVTIEKTAVIPSGMFSGCVNLSSVTILGKDIKIESYAFMGCKKLKSISLSNVSSIGSSAFSGSGLTSVVFPDRKISTGYTSFAGCEDLVSVVSDGYITIYQGCFYECPNLESVVFRKGASLVHRAFGGCTGLKSVIFGGKSNIGDYVFDNCKNIEDIYCFYGNMAPVSGIAFTNAYVEYATLHVPEDLVDQYSNDAVWGKFNKIVPLTHEDIAAHVPSMGNTALSIRSHNGTFVVDGASAGTPITVYTSTGVLAGFATATKGRTTLYTKMQKGDVAIVKIGQQTKRLIIK